MTWDLLDCRCEGEVSASLREEMNWMLEALDGYPRATHEMCHVHGAMPPPVSERVAGKLADALLQEQTASSSPRAARRSGGH